MTSTSNKYSYKRAFQAGLMYSMGVFAIGFALGGVRMMVLLPRMSELWAVILELPIILGLSWLLCKQAILRLTVAANPGARIAMGATALLSLLCAEYWLWSLAFDDGSGTFLERYTATAGQLGLAGQFLYASFPLLQMRGIMTGAMGR